MIIILNNIFNFKICISAVLSSSIVGETLINTLNSLTFLQSDHIQSVITSLINTVQSLHTLNQKMCSSGMNCISCFIVLY